MGKVGMKRTLLLGSFTVGLLMPFAGWGQSAEQVAVFAKSMPTAQQPAIVATVVRLGAMNSLPAGVWRVHPGDIPHGESTGLDDSTWAIAKAGDQYPKDAVWFRRWIEVPKQLKGYDLTGTRIWFHFGARLVGQGTLTSIIYFDGRRVALGETLEQLELFNHAKPGDRILVAVKLLGTTVPKRFDNSSERVEFSDARPNPQDLHDEFISAMQLIPSLSKSIDNDEGTLRKAIEEVDFKALDDGNQQQFDASLHAASLTLEALRPMLQTAIVHLTGDAHIDAAWLWPRTETVDVVKRTFSTSLQLMDEYPSYTFTQSAAAYNDWLADKYPELDREIKQRITEGRWEVVGGMWVEPDLNIPDGESTARSILLGKRWYQKQYGVDVHVGWNPDSFGYNWQLPQIYKKSGIDFFVTQKMSWNDTNKLPFKLFWWESPDGSKVLTYFPHGYVNRDMSPVRLSADLVQARTFAPGMTEMMDLYGVGDHGGGPTRDMLEQSLQWMEPGMVAPKMEFGTAASYFSTVSKQVAPQSRTWNYRTMAQGYEYPAEPPAGEISIPTWNDEMYLEYHRGVYTTQAKMKRNLREAPEWTLNAEKYASLAWLQGNAYPGDELTDAWKKITFNGFHDLAAGSGIAVIYRDAQKDFDQVRWETQEISGKALETLASRVDTMVAEGVPVIVFNPLAWQRSGNVTVDVQMPNQTGDVSVLDTRGEVLPSKVLSRDSTTNTLHLLVAAEEVPSMGYEVLRVVPERRRFASDLKVTGTTMENTRLRVVVDPKTGCITSLYDRKGAFETLTAGTCGNELQAFKDTPTKYDAWNIDPGTLDHPPSLLTAADSVQVTETGPMRAVVRIARTWQKSTFVQQIVLYAGSDQVEVVNDIDWHETHVLLKTAFTLSASGPFATYEIPFGSIQRPTTRDNSWERARFEVPAERWADLGNTQHGMSLINDSKFGYDAAGNVLRLTLLRSPTDPDPDADRGPQHFSFALYPHSADWKQAMTIRHGYEFNYGLKAMQVEAHTGPMPKQSSFVSLTSPNVILTAMKKAEDSDSLIFHLYEWAGTDGRFDMSVPSGAIRAVQTNLLEHPEEADLPLHLDRVSLSIHPYEIMAFRVDYSGKK